MFTIIGSGKNTELYVLPEKGKTHACIKGEALVYLIELLNASGVK